MMIKITGNLGVCLYFVIYVLLFYAINAKNHKSFKKNFGPPGPSSRWWRTSRPVVKHCSPPIPPASLQRPHPTPDVQVARESSWTLERVWLCQQYMGNPSSRQQATTSSTSERSSLAYGIGQGGQPNASTSK